MPAKVFVFSFMGVVTRFLSYQVVGYSSDSIIKLLDLPLEYSSLLTVQIKLYFEACLRYLAVVRKPKNMESNV